MFLNHLPLVEKDVMVRGFGLTTKFFLNVFEKMWKVEVPYFRWWLLKATIG